MSKSLIVQNQPQWDRERLINFVVTMSHKLPFDLGNYILISGNRQKFKPLTKYMFGSPLINHENDRMAEWQRVEPSKLLQI